jgi:hypothetical protein
VQDDLSESGLVEQVLYLKSMLFGLRGIENSRDIHLLGYKASFHVGCVPIGVNLLYESLMGQGLQGSVYLII